MVSHTGSQSQLQQGPPDPPKGVAALTNLFSNGCARISNRTQGARALGSLSLIPSVHPSVYPWGKGTQAKDNTLSCKLLYALKCSVIRYRKHTPKKTLSLLFLFGWGHKILSSIGGMPKEYGIRGVEFLLISQEKRVSPALWSTSEQPGWRQRLLGHQH